MRGGIEWKESYQSQRKCFYLVISILYSGYGLGFEHGYIASAGKEQA
jgi:hypothetical protein